MAEFADQATLRAEAGNGGNGCVSIHREKFKPLGGPDGGNGGRGGDVILEVSRGATTLLDFHRRPLRRAGHGKPGAGSNRNGAAGSDLELRVPEGTVVKTTGGAVLADLVGEGTRFVAARGGRGGLGNAALASARRKAPGFALKGEPGERRDLVLELKTVADVGLIGFPNAGKSSIIAAMSAARPKIANYPFTTLIPHLGVIEAGNTQFVAADVPGLIPGASEGRGLGLDFLRHVERCAVLVHVLDCATEEPGRDPVTDMEVIEAELAAYEEATGASLAGRPRIVVLNKIDVPAARERADRVGAELAARGLTVCPASAATREGLRELSFAMAAVVEAARAAEPEAEPTRQVLRPAPADEPGFEVVRTGDNSFLIRGERPRRWVLQTDFGNDEAVGYLADRLARLGVEESLAELGAQPGAEVLIGDEDDAVVFDWAPELPAGSIGRGQDRGRGGPRFGPRGTDRRLFTMTGGRQDVAAARRVVVKVGSSSLTTPAGGIDEHRLTALADALAARVGDGTQLVLVSSGAIAAGLAPLGLSRRPRDLATQQAAASVGQGILVARYTAAFGRHGVRTGQVLLTADDLMRRAHYRNAQRTLDRLLGLGVLPVVNENDTVATEEIRFGDNDRLAALVAHVVRAGALVLLSDVDALYDGDPQLEGTRRITEVHGPGDLTAVALGRPRDVSGPRGSGPRDLSGPRGSGLRDLSGPRGSGPRDLSGPRGSVPRVSGLRASGPRVSGPEGPGAPGPGIPGASGRPAGDPGRVIGTGGMVTKVESALLAAGAGIPAVVAAADQAVAALAGEPVGTYFVPGHRRPGARQLWLAHAAVGRGRLRLDGGAVRAVVGRRASLLPAGVVGVEGDFEAGDPVNLCDEGGGVIARGLVNYDAAEIPGLMGRTTRSLAAELGPAYEREIVHRDDLVLLG